MTGSYFAEKDRFTAFLEDIIANKKSGLVSIITESKHSILLKFSRGACIHSYSRNIGIREAIKFINESNRVKFDIAPIPVEAGTEILPGSLLLQLLGSEVTPEKQVANYQPLGAGNKPDLESHKSLLEDIAADYVGVVAGILVEESMDESGSIDETIDRIASVIPNPEQSAAFRSSARKQLRQIEL